MPCTAPCIKILLCILVLAIAACSSTGSKPKGHGQPSKAVVSQGMMEKNISPQVKRSYQQALDLMRSKKYRKAEKVLQQITELEPDLAGPYVNLGIIYYNQEKYETAEKFFQQALQRNPENADIHNFLGVTYRQQGHFKAAEKAYKQAIAINPRLAKVYLNLGVLYDIYLANISAAIENYLQYQKLNPNDKRVNNWLADLNQRLQASKL